MPEVLLLDGLPVGRALDPVVLDQLLAVAVEVLLAEPLQLELLVALVELQELVELLGVELLVEPVVELLGEEHTGSQELLAKSN